MPIDSERVFDEVERDRLSDVVAERILEFILNRRLKPGDRLPSERELAEQFNVSRTVVREAVRNLAGRSVISARAGSGLTVAAVPADAVRQSVHLYLRSRPSWDYRRVHEVRMIMEVNVAGLAAVRATDAEIERMRDACDEMAGHLDDTELAARIDVGFHSLLAAATHNDLVSIMLDAIADSLIEIRRETFGPRGRAREALQSHREILARVAARDEGGARDAMARHLSDVEVAWEQKVSPAADASSTVT